MARDSELDRLIAAKDAAKRRHDEAFEQQQRAYAVRKDAGDAQSRAYERQDAAYKTQQRAWERLQSIRTMNGPRIDTLNDLQQRAYQNMCAAYDQASAAHNRRDGAAAASYAADGRVYKAESQGYVLERRRLIAEIKAASEALHACKPTFQEAKAAFQVAKAHFQAAKAEHEKAVANFKQAKAEFLAAREAFQNRLDQVRRSRELQKESDRRIAERAGVPMIYLDNMVVSHAPDGGLNFYFGGVGSPDGPGHGHYSVDRLGTVTYRREPFEPHGSQNFTDDPRFPRLDGGFAEACWYEGQPGLKESGIDNRTGRQTINIYYGGQGGPLGKGHGHVVMYQDDPGTVVFHRRPS